MQRLQETINETEQKLLKLQEQEKSCKVKMEQINKQADEIKKTSKGVFHYHLQVNVWIEVKSSVDEKEIEIQEIKKKSQADLQKLRQTEKSVSDIVYHSYSDPVKYFRQLVLTGFAPEGTK